jgi:hypothetical protein
LRESRVEYLGKKPYQDIQLQKIDLTEKNNAMSLEAPSWRDYMKDLDDVDPDSVLHWPVLGVADMLSISTIKKELSSD